MLDDMIDYIATIRERPVWQPIPDAVRARVSRRAAARAPSDLADVYREFTDFIAPYATGNVHPGFMGWVHGGGTAVGMLAEMLAAGLNANLGGRDHMPIEVERQIVDWMRELFGFPAGASGIFVTGTSMANLMAVLVARTSALGKPSRQHGIGEERRVADGLHVEGGAWLHHQGDGHRRASAATRCAAIAVDAIASHRRRGAARADRERSRRPGCKPFLVVGSAGTVDIGAIDDLRRDRATVPRGRALVPRRRRLRRARDPLAGARAAACRHRARRFDRARFPQMGAGALRRRLPAGARRRAASRRPSPRRRPICGARRGGWPPARSGPAISAPICRAAFAR